MLPLDVQRMSTKSKKSIKESAGLKDRQLLIRPFLARVQYIDHWDLPPSD